MSEPGTTCDGCGVRPGTLSGSIDLGWTVDATGTWCPVCFDDGSIIPKHGMMTVGRALGVVAEQLRHVFARQKATRYVILTLEDAQWLAESADGCAGRGPRGPWDELNHAYLRHDVIGRLKAETGADIGDIVDQLKRLEFCPACVIEGQQHTCSALEANKLGRRLARLVDRANERRTT